MRTLPAFIMVGLVALAGFTGSSSAGSTTAPRLLTVTSRDAAGTKHVDQFFVGPDDRVYVTRHEAEVIHTADGSVAGVDFAPGFTFGNLTVTRVPR